MRLQLCLHGVLARRVTNDQAVPFLAPGFGVHTVKESPTTASGLHRVACGNPQQWLYLLGDDGVVYSEVNNRFAGLDAAGVSAFRAFDAGAALEDLDGPRVVGGDASTSYEGLKAVYDLSRGIFPAENAPAQWPPFQSSKWSDTAIANIEIDGIPVSLQYPPGPLASLCQDYFRNCVITERPPRCCLSAQQAEDGWAIYVNGVEFLPSLQERQLGLGLLHAARSLLYAQGDYDVAFHAAMVAHDNFGIMLSAPRECGKSTLAVHLVTQGFDLLADEPALLNFDTWSIRSLHLPVSLKQESWPTLQQHWPALSGSPVHIRSDGTKIRLAHPPEERYSSRARPITHIVFPHYGAASGAQVESISPFRTLCFLNNGGMLFARHIARDGFENFLKFVCFTPAYRIHYSSLQEADRMLREIGCFAA
ncbi:hypothetical protein [Acidicapsa acidisoli]|uniref:hypothetical protein n=1 Tax=Acidicapsa acidisoli TaxID=1615681 RepID=UPI0021E0AB4A|nr:hypothetical protein [Acidicapsa acidisoli]